MNRAASIEWGTALVDARSIELFASVVFGYVDGPVAVRILTEAGKQSGVPWTETHLADGAFASRLVEAANRAASAGRALYVVPATLKSGSSATADNIAATAVIPVDLDEGDIEAKRRFLVETLGPATLTVASGGLSGAGARKLHLYWRLTEAASGDDLGRVAGLRATLAEKAGGDISFKRITQPIRVAGSLHCKTYPPRLVEILDHSEAEIDLADAEQRVREMASRSETSNSGEGVRGFANLVPAEALKGMRIRAEGQDQITRFEALSRIIGHWIRRVRLCEVTLEEAWSAVQDHNVTLIVPPWDNQRLRREFDAIHVRDRSANQAAWAKLVRDPLTPDEASDDALAAAFVENYGRDWRFMPAEHTWYGWSGKVWRRDQLNSAAGLVRLVCRERAAQCDKPGEARRIASSKTIQAVVRIATSDPRITITPDAFDTHPMRLNSPGGVIDLESGVFEANPRDLLMSRITTAEPGGGRTRWLVFLEEITGRDKELEGYLKRLAGYCLTGSTAEQVFFFLYGAGANGKSVFLDALANALGDYAKTAPFETFAATNYVSHPTDLAGLKGARLVLVTETDRARDWAESRIKAVTGGDPISARFMRGDFFEYRPTFKLIVAGNHRPGLKSFGEAMRRRLHLVPFDVTIPPDKRDRNLQEKLKAEEGGILAWMIEGCSEWRERGLDPPARVLAAAEEYFAEEDMIGQWLAEHCELRPDLRVSARDLFASWKVFAETGGHPAGTAKQLGSELRLRGLEQVRTGRARGWRGVAISRLGATE